MGLGSQERHRTNILHCPRMASVNYLRSHWPGFDVCKLHLEDDKRSRDVVGPLMFEPTVPLFTTERFLSHCCLLLAMYPHPAF
jgi:hypothetical protein